MPGWFELLSAALGGGITVKVLDIFYQELISFRTSTSKARAVVDQHLDPVLKSADEVVGKVRALAERDFVNFEGFSPADDWTFIDNRDVSSLVYLFAAFWCHLELLRQESLFVELVRDERGKKLKKFLDCLESRRSRVLDRVTQRAIGELMIDGAKKPPGAIPYVRMAELYETNKRFRTWTSQLVDILASAHGDKQTRQRILVYGTILHAMIDTLDPKHFATKERPAFPNKLTRKSRESLRRRVFGVYVPEVRQKEKYYRVRRG